MKRFILTNLKYWKNDKSRKPLILRGARQVGKTFTVRDFAQSHFSHFVEINFELQPQLKKIFQTLDPYEIVRDLSLALGEQIKPGSTLLFFDEIQECPEAISALRYFYEKMPELHVIGAGSLLEFILKSPDFKMPVGRIEYLYMQPMSFGEFLLARQEDRLKNYLDELTVKTLINEAVHEKLLRLFKDYLIVGGMPEVVKVFLEDPSQLDYQKIQLSLLQTYRDDFGKYASRAKHDHLKKIFQTAPSLVGQIFKYTQVDRQISSRDLKAALQLLAQAGIVTKVLSTSGHELPFLKDANEKKFKILFLDVGLMQRACGLDSQIALTDDFLSIRSGAVAEQFVGQELMMNRNLRVEPELYFWSRDKKSSQAEIDFLTVIDSKIIPIEVKAGKTGTLKSLKVFLKEHKSPFGIRFSQLPLSFHDKILSIPIYAVEQMRKIASEL